MSIRIASIDENAMEPIVRSVILVSRLGESGLAGWWGTHSFGPAGRVVLKQRLPRTWQMAAVELDIAAATNRHNEKVDRPNAVHLFSDNWPVRRWASAWVAEQKTVERVDGIFTDLESISRAAILSSLPSASGRATPPDGSALCVGSIRRGDLTDVAAVATATSKLAAAYATLGDRFAAPYLEIDA